MAAPADVKTPRDDVGTPQEFRHRRKPITPYLLLIPAVGILLVALGYPFIWQFLVSFQQYGRGQLAGLQDTQWIGFDNYTSIATDPYFWTVVARSIAFCLVNAFFTVLIGVLFALLMNAVNKVARMILQVAMLLAWAMPIVASMTVWRWLFDTRNGVINWLLTNVFGMDGYSIHNWLEHPLSFFAVATIIIVWMSVPFVAFSVYAGVIQISEETMEAASLDGANGWQRFRLITLPMIRPVLLIVLLLQIIWDLRVFAQIRMLQDAGGIPSDTNLLGTYIFQLSNGKYGMAAAVSIFVLILTVALSSFYIRILLKDEED